MILILALNGSVLDRARIREASRRGEVLSIVIRVLALNVRIILVIVRLAVLFGVLVYLLSFLLDLGLGLSYVFDGPWALRCLEPFHLAVLLLCEIVVFLLPSFGGAAFGLFAFVEQLGQGLEVGLLVGVLDGSAAGRSRWRRLRVALGGILARCLRALLRVRGASL